MTDSLRLLSVAEAAHPSGIPDLVVTVEIAGRPVRFAVIGHELVASAGDWAAGFDGNGTGLDSDGAGLDSLLVVVEPLTFDECEALGYDGTARTAGQQGSDEGWNWEDYDDNPNR